jgi:hypothetical protein
LIKAEGRTTCFKIHKLITSLWKKEELPEDWKESITAPIYKKGDKSDCNNYRGISLCQLHTTFYPTLVLKVNSICRRNYWGSSVWISTQQVKY